MSDTARFFMSLPISNMEMIDNVVKQINETKSRECSKTNRQGVIRALVRYALSCDLRYKSTWSKFVSASLKEVT